jgi:hypothetical protein
VSTLLLPPPRTRVPLQPLPAGYAKPTPAGATGTPSRASGHDAAFVVVAPAAPPAARARRGVLSQTFATITKRMRLNLFARNDPPDPSPDPARSPSPAATTVPVAQQRTGRTFPADEVVWGIVIRNGFDEIDDPLYHRGTTQHAYLEGNDTVALCGFRPPQSGSRTRRRPRLGLPTTGQHPMCGMCARMVVAPRPRVPVPVQPARPVPVPVARGAGQAPLVPAPYAQVPTGGAVPNAPGAAAVSPWVRRAAGDAQPPVAPPGRPDSQENGLLSRGVHADIEP